MKNHDIVEKNVGLMVILIVVAISFGGLVEIVPLFFDKALTENKMAYEQSLSGDEQEVVQLTVNPYTPLQLEGRDIYIREGCVGCHSQMIRPFRAETERYGHYSLGAESVYDHPFLWGSKRTGPDLARVGGRYSDEWHRAHLINPRDVVPESVMPPYPFLAENVLDGKHTAIKMEALRKVGVPYTDEQISSAAANVAGKTELDALVAYLQVLGTYVPRGIRGVKPASALPTPEVAE
ncbi:cytochrome-c oxidase, cbb3-type subunit II [Zooshikella sp. RANM57]|uniref:cytochrome-c oxidase, cbb3-type subunit II n=1 Tax=Zooshikella sp. RANM57 TaxID=3425863 RepID=UPI003D6F7DD5